MEKELNIISQNNILKCEGRLKNAPITTDAKLPILINCNHYLAKLMVWDVRLKLKQAGCKQVSTEI